MTTQSTLGPFMTLILTLTAKRQRAADVMNVSPAEVVKSLLFAQLLNGIPTTKPAGHARPSARVFRIGSSQECRVGS
jgi:hypothetical protein